jgi:hypothetical protein
MGVTWYPTISWYNAFTYVFPQLVSTTGDISYTLYWQSVGGIDDIVTLYPVLTIYFYPPF